MFPVGPGRTIDLRHRALVVVPAPGGGASPSADPDLVLVDVVGDAHDPGPARGAVPVVRRPEDVPSGAPALVLADGLAATSAEAAEADALATVGATAAAGLQRSLVVVDLALDAAPTREDAAARLAATAGLVALGHPVCVAVDSPLGPVEATVAAAMLAGARFLRVPAAGGVRRVRRAADLSEALLAERPGPVAPGVDP